MCELYAFSGRRPESLTKDLRTFFSHSDTNPHGWGYAAYTEGETLYEREPVPSAESEKLKGILAEMEATDFKTRLMLAHIREASIGSLSEENNHPFTALDHFGKRWFFVHNGTIVDGPELEEFRDKQTGKTDSERLFLYFLSLYEGGLDPIRAAETVANRLAEKNTLNFMATDGEILLVHANRTGRLHWRDYGEGIEISTFPLTDEEGWEEVPLSRVYCIREDYIVYKGQSHGFVKDSVQLPANAH